MIKKKYIEPEMTVIAWNEQMPLLAGSPTLEFTTEGDEDYADPDIEVL